MRTVLFDASRLFIRGSRFSPTGIDRVVLAYARWLLSRADIDLQPVVTTGGQIWRMPRALLAGIIENAEIFRAATRNQAAVSTSWAALAAALQAEPNSDVPPLRAASVMAQFPARAIRHANVLTRSAWRLRPAKSEEGAVYINVSHTGLGNPHVLARLRAKGVRCVVMVHDLIPIEYPEYCAPGAYGRHVRRMDGVMGNANLVIANSQTTADSMIAYAAGLGRSCPLIKVAHLGIEPDFFAEPSPLTAPIPYFVCIGTLEARKNLTFLLALWRHLTETLGTQVPRLVLVGRRGWENESVIDHLERSAAVRKSVHEVSDLQDCELAMLVAGARALLAPSFAEGFDLPVTEALSLRTPVIASDIAVHRELAPQAMLLDPLDGPGWLAAIATAKAVKGPAFRAPRWDDHFAALQNAILGRDGSG